MTKLESLDKLREICAKWRKMSVTPGRNSASDEVEVIADAIQAEIDSRYMLLPVDADGVLIRVGDTMRTISDYKQHVDGICTDGFYTHKHGNDYRKNYAADYIHVKPRTLTDVLSDLFNRKMSVTDAEHEIGELLGGDAE